MPRYHFIVHAVDVLDDPEGLDCPGDAAALAEAAKIIREVKADNTGVDFLGWSLEVTEGERRVALIPFEAVQ
jgi:hypothetical protein